MPGVVWGLLSVAFVLTVDGPKKAAVALEPNGGSVAAASGSSTNASEPGAALIRGRVRFIPSDRETTEVGELFRLGPAEFDYTMRKTRETADLTVWRVTFPSPLPSPLPENNVVPLDYFAPKVPAPGGADRRPAVVVLHILGADFALSRYLCARLAQRGVAAAFLQLPYYGDRRPPGGDQRFLSADIERSVAAMRQGVCDVRYAVAWLAQRPEVDPERLGVAGISLGGIISSLVAANDPHVREGAFLLAGGGLDDILWDMPEREARLYKRKWLELGRTKADLTQLTSSYDPLTYASRLKGKRLLMIAGNVDEVVPAESAQRLWDAAGRPPIRWLDCGHYSAAAYLLPEMRNVVEFFVEGPYAPPRPPILGNPPPPMSHSIGRE